MTAHIFQFPDGSVAIALPVRPLRPFRAAVMADGPNGKNTVEREPAIPAETQSEYDAAIIAQAKTALGMDGAAHVGTIDAAALPDHSTEDDLGDIDAQGVPVITKATGRAYRAAWRWDGAAVVADNATKRAAIYAKLRSRRNALLDASDAEILKVQEQGNAAAVTGWKNYRQALRDLPANINVNMNMAEIRAIWPAKP